MTLENAEFIRRAHWVESYRLAHRAADRWAESPSGIRHSIETQDRIFRMVDELRLRRDWPNAKLFFPVLIAVDDAASWDTGPGGAPTPMSASAAGLVGYKVLSGKLPPIRGYDWPDGFELTEEEEAELVTLGLRFHGFDPIVFDGTDPAAYVWALFEVTQRDAAYDAKGHDRRRTCPPRALAVVPTPVQPRTPVPTSLRRSAEPAGVGR